jgi:hypothetical protein
MEYSVFQIGVHLSVLVSMILNVISFSFHFMKLISFSLLYFKSWDTKSVGIALGYGLNDRDSRVPFPAGGVGIFLFTTASRTALGPTQPPIQWIPWTLSLGVKRLGREADHSPPSNAEVKE